MRPRIACASADAFDRAEVPLVLASRVSLVVLSSAAEVGVGESLLRGHDCWWLVDCFDLRVAYGRSPETYLSSRRLLCRLRICLCLGIGKSYVSRSLLTVRQRMTHRWDVVKGRDDLGGQMRSRSA